MLLYLYTLVPHPIIICGRFTKIFPDSFVPLLCCCVCWTTPGEGGSRICMSCTAGNINILSFCHHYHSFTIIVLLAVINSVVLAVLQLNTSLPPHLELHLPPVRGELVPLLYQAPPASPVLATNITNSDPTVCVSPLYCDPAVPPTHLYRVSLLHWAYPEGERSGPHTQEPGGGGHTGEAHCSSLLHQGEGRGGGEYLYITAHCGNHHHYHTQHAVLLWHLTLCNKEDIQQYTTLYTTLHYTVFTSPQFFKQGKYQQPLQS